MFTPMGLGRNGDQVIVSAQAQPLGVSSTFLSHNCSLNFYKMKAGNLIPAKYQLIIFSDKQAAAKTPPQYYMVQFCLSV